VQAQIIKFDEFELDLGRYELRRQGRAIKLEKVPMELLILLAEREGQLVTREEIIQRLWGPDVFVDTRQGINTAIRKIRLALKDDPDNPRILQTVFGKGYRLVAPVTIAESSVPRAGAAPNPEATLPSGQSAVPGPHVGPGPNNGTVAASSASESLEISGSRLVARGPIEPKLARWLFLTIQAGYLVLYAAAFVLFPNIARIGLPWFVPQLILVAGLIGAAVRLYLIAAVGFNYSGSGTLFRQAFPGILALDAFWAASPLLLFGRLGFLTLLFVAALVFLPFSQRTLILSIYDAGKPPVRPCAKASEKGRNVE
jgi:DNA-binding winged helix-turn-helix (wHTH) protein